MRRVFVSVALLSLAASQAFAAPPAQRALPSRFAELLERSPLVPVASYLELTPEQSQTVPMFAAGEALPIFMNRHGGTYYGGENDSATNHSSIVNGGSADVGSFSGTDSQWSQVMSCVQDLFSRFNVVVTDTEPTSGVYLESVVGGSPQDIDMPWGVAGVAPFDPYGCGVIPNAVVYTFSDVYQGSSRFVRDVCETAAQEIAHAFTLDHQMLCEDPMTYLSGCGNKTFQDEYATCGEYEPRECACNGNSQNSVQLLYEKLGSHDGTPPPPPPEDGELPTVTLLDPADGATLQANSTVEIVAEAKDDVGLVAVELLWAFTDESMPCPGQGGAWSCTRTGDTHRWTVSVGQGMRMFRVRVRDVVGNVVNSEERSLWFSPDGSGPPDDEYAPEVRIVTPREGVQHPPNSVMEIVASASDDSGIARVELLWDFRDQVFPCPFESRFVSCTEDGSTYTWQVHVGEGVRGFSVRATDLVGNVAETGKRNIVLQQGAAGDRPLSNDTYDLADELQCGDTVTLTTEPGNEDWFDVAVPDGERVVVNVTGDVSDNLELTATTGPHSSDVFADAEGDPALTFSPPDGSEVRVRVRPYSESGEYTLTVECLPPEADALEPTPTPSPSFLGGCAQGGDSDTSPPTGLAVLGLVGLALLRRRRR